MARLCRDGVFGFLGHHSMDLEIVFEFDYKDIGKYPCEGLFPQKEPLWQGDGKTWNAARFLFWLSRYRTIIKNIEADKELTHTLKEECRRTLEVMEKFVQSEIEDWGRAF